MKLQKWFAIGICAVLLLSLVGSVGAGPADNPGQGPPQLEKKVFVHYPKDYFPGKGGIPAKPPKPPKPTRTPTPTPTITPTPTPTPPPSGGACSDSYYKLDNMRWPSGTTVQYEVNLAGSGGGPSFGTAIQESFNTWNSARDNVAGIAFSYKGETTRSAGGDSDGHNVISWQDLTKSYPGAIAVTTIWYWPGLNVIVEVDTAMNNGYGFTWSYTPPNASGCDDPVSATTGYFDVRNIMTHEAGHFIVLDDIYNDAHALLTMYGYGSTNELNKDTLALGDTLGFQAAY